MTSASTPPVRSIPPAIRRRRCRPGIPGSRPGPPAPAAAAPPRWPVPVPGRRVRVPSPPVRSRCSPMTPRWAAGRRRGTPPSRPHHPRTRRRRRPHGRRARRARGTALRRARRPLGAAPTAGDGPRRPSGSGGGGRRWPRRLLWTLVALLGLGLLAPVVAFLVGWVMFDVPVGEPDRGHAGRHVQVRGRRRAGHHPAGQRQPHDRPARPGARARPAGRAVGRGPLLLLQPRLRPHRHRPGAVEPGHRRGRRRIDHHPAVREGLHRPGPGVAVAQVQGDRARGQDLPGADQGPDPRELPERHLPRPRRLRHPGRQPGLLRQGRQGPLGRPRARCSPA